MLRFVYSFFKLIFSMVCNTRGDASVDVAMVKMYSANVAHLVQQKESRLLPHCRRVTQNGEADFYDRLGKREAREKEGRNSKITFADPDHSRRRVTARDIYDAVLVDKEDKLRTIMNLNNEYTVAMGYAIGRKYDEKIIGFALGNAYGGKEGSEVVTLPTSQKLCAFDGVSAAGVGLNPKTCRAVKKKFNQNEAVQKGQMIVWVLAAQQIDDLLGNTEVTSSDFNTVKALAQGDVNSWMGFLFERTELLGFTTAATTYSVTDGSVGAGAGTVASGEGRRTFAFVPNSAILVAIGENTNTTIDRMPEYGNADLIQTHTNFGGTRMEEEQLMEIICKEL